MEGDIGRFKMEIFDSKTSLPADEHDICEEAHSCKQYQDLLNLTDACHGGILTEDPVKISPCTTSTEYNPRVETSEVFHQIGEIVQERVKEELDIFQARLFDILSEQQHEYQKLFGHQSCQSPQGYIHVVPQCRYFDEASSEDAGSSQSECIRVEDMPVSNCRHMNTVQQIPYKERPDIHFSSSGCYDELSEPFSGYPPSQEIDDSCKMHYLIRMLTASLIISKALRRKEYEI